jgi:uncharacterized protein
MRRPFTLLFNENPFGLLRQHTEKIKECAWKFQHAVECQVSRNCENFEEVRLELEKMASEAVGLGDRIRNQLPKGVFSAIQRFQLVQYLRAEESILAAIQQSLNWFTYREEVILAPTVEKDFFLLVESVMDPIEDLTAMINDADRYCSTFSAKPKKSLLKKLEDIRRQEREAGQAEERLKRRAFETLMDPVSVFRMFRLAENIGAIARHAAIAGDLMRSMIPL